MNPIFPILVLVIASCANAQSIASPRAIYSSDFWTQFGQNAQHHSRANTPTIDLAATLWVSVGDESTTLEFLPQAGVVADESRVYAVGYDLNDPADDLLAAFDQSTGDLIWTTPVPFAILDSWSTPSIDPASDTIFVASGAFISAFDSATGAQRWQAPLDRPVVNASPVVTHDLRFADRLFISDYSFGSAMPGQLYCINIDPYHPILNPYLPGDRVWSVMLAGDTSGNTPVYARGSVFVATANSSSDTGLIYSFDATSTTVPDPDWVTPNPEPHGFYAGLTIANGSVFAASYNFSIGQHNANTIKLDASNGALIWTTPSNRTDTSPVVLRDGRVAISGGPPTGAFTFFGARPSIALYSSSGDLLWDTAIETHSDTNNNKQWDPGEPYLSIGGWTHLPILTGTINEPRLLVGSLANPDTAGFYAACTDLRLIDLNAYPTDPGFIISHAAGAGSTPAVANSTLFSVGESGLHAFPATSTPTKKTK